MPIPHLKPTDEPPRTSSPPDDDASDDRRPPTPPLTRPREMFRRFLPRLRRRLARRRLTTFWLPILGIVALSGVFALVVVFAWFSRDLPNPEKISDRSVAQSTRIYARDGKTLLYEIHGDERRTVVELKDIAPDVVHATIAIEDKDFYRHKGFSLVGIIRAIWRDLTTGSSQGGSTITQQFVKNAILTNEKRLTRKIRELVLAYQIERRFTKDQILKLYFNEIPYGSNAYGVEAAANKYFGKPARDLTLAESAILAAIPQAPTHYSPYGNHTDELIGRAHYILDLMVQQGYATRQQADEAKAVDVLATVKPKRETILAPHFVFYVRELLTQKYGERLVEQGGLRVTTTLDIDKQLAAEQAIADQATTNEQRWGAKNAALVAIDPKTGQVLAMVGSRDYFDAANDGNVNVTLTLQQPGSSIKPIVYATAFARGFTPDTILFDLKTHFKVPGSRDYVPNNYDGKERGPLMMRKALAGSLNIPAVKTLYLAGVDHVIDQAQRMGYTTWADRSRLGLALVLGGADVKPIEHVAAFGAFATDGVLHTTAAILRVEDRSGHLLEEYKDREARVLDENVARTINDVLSDNDARSFIFGARNRLTLPDRPVAAKTGTTQEYRDGWTLGFTPATSKEPAIVAGVWVGNNGNTPMKPGADGSVVAAPIWNAFMRKAVAGTKPVKFKKFEPSKTDKPILSGKIEGELPIPVDRVTGRAIPASCLEQWPAEFVVQKTVRAVHTILYYVDPADPTGPPPDDPAKDPQFASWEEPVQRWAKEHGYLEQRPALESCNLRTQRPTVTILTPAADETARGDTLAVSVNVTGPHAIGSIVYSIDGLDVATASPAATSATINLQTLGNGFHTIRVVAKDDVENAGETSVTVNVLRDLSTGSAYFVAPTSTTTVDAASSVVFRAFAFDPSGVASLSFNIVDPSGGTTELPTAGVGADTTAGATWTAPATTGSYRVSFRAVANSGKVYQSDSLIIIVR